VSDDPATAPAWPPRGWHESTMLVSPGLPMLAGHFPGRPVVPGVAQLALAIALAGRAYAGACPRLLRRAKFRAPVEPATPGLGQASLTCQLFPTKVAGEVEFVLSAVVDRLAPEPRTDPGARVAEGFLGLSPRRPDVPLEPAPRPPVAPPPDQPPITAVLPHRAPALLVQRALHLGAGADDAAWFEGRVPADNFLVRDGRADVLAALEFAAQGAACLDVLRGFAQGGARMLQGWLVGVKAAALHAPDFAADAQLVASLRTAARGSFVNVTTQVGASGFLVVDAELQIFVQ